MLAKAFYNGEMARDSSWRLALIKTKSPQLKEFTEKPGIKTPPLTLNRYL